ncbi:MULTISPECIES: hypothetical protein [unclassified Spirillospora]|uniref:hypothetical protein n=1 Tax=unclassified Spirillospora TaxID=2642701 RepID=UPI003720E1B6
METGKQLEWLRGGEGAQRVFGEPYDRPDGATVIPVAQVTGGRCPRATPLGVFVVHEGRASWTPAVDGTRIALLGGLIGLVAAGLATAAVLRRPPWPDISIHKIMKNH